MLTAAFGFLSRGSTNELPHGPHTEKTKEGTSNGDYEAILENSPYFEEKVDLLEGYSTFSRTTTSALFIDRARRFRSVVPSPVPMPIISATDSLGRVTILDSRDLSSIRIFKGYRDAQVAWIVWRASGRRLAPSLLVYAPKRNSIELWDVLALQRLNTIRIPREATLLYSNPASCTVVFLSRNGELMEIEYREAIPAVSDMPS